ncbi:hypothetical protein QPK24_20075 [Paenibacillus polygoni]|uniref:Uncharacterized protein n=1 Tax=Paenibacillus polygoni TaxID=3050112 RepID=A0ABY8X0F6_9BACL|nr:hypothetical protein [Paenibacillus polygoni]WIV18634.1 hypothetical protein QPK24_20075 [Paenibacillus polygoni]
MSKGLSLWFAASSIILLIVTAVSLSHSLWLALLFSILAIGNIGWGFVIKAKRNRAELNQS